MKLAAYLRVSTDGQAERGFGLEVQEQAIRSWASSAGHEVAIWCRDEGISGTKDATERPGLTDALSAVKQGEVNGLVVARLDRLARALTVSEAVLAQIWKYEGTVFSADVGEVMRDDPDDPMRCAMRQMAAVFAQLDRATTISRLRAGRRVKAERGGFAYGAPPFGFRAEAGELVPVEGEQVVIARIVELHSTGTSLRGIAGVLTAEGHTCRKSAAWHLPQLRRIIARAEGRTLPARRAPSWAKKQSA